jgi:hypothetical protein
LVLGVAVWTLSASAPTLPRAVAGISASSCRAVSASRASRAFDAARARYLTEARGAVIHADLRRLARDGILLSALAKRNLRAALAEASRQLVRHVVRIRVLQGSRVLIDANSHSFDVAGSGIELRAADGRNLGRLEITVQDVIGFIKLVHKLDAADVVVRGAYGEMRSSLPAAANLPLPSSGCARVGSRRYAVRSFQERSFSGEPLTIWLLS